MKFNFGHFWAKYQGYSLTFWPKLAHCHHFSMCNQNQWSSILVIFGQNTKAIAFLFGQNWLIFITCQCAIKFNEVQFWSFFAKYQGYSLTVWPKLAHVHHFSMCNENQWSSILVIVRQNTKAIALLFGQIGSFSSLFNVQSKSMKFNFGHCWAKYQGYSLTFWPNWLIFITFQCAIKINEVQFWPFLGKIPRL